MKTFWKILPLALPLLVLVSVLSACGKGDKVNGNIFNQLPKPKILGGSAQRATGAASSSLSLQEFKDGCAEKNGQVEVTRTGALCAVKVVSKTLDANAVGETQVILADYHEGDLILSHVSSGSISHADGDIRLGGVHLMDFGARAMPPVATADKVDHLTMVLMGQVAAAATVTVWTCLDERLNRVTCANDVFR